MKQSFCFYSSVLWFLLIITILGGCRKDTEPESTTKTDLRILYISNPQSARAKDFLDFLSKHFAAVQTGDLKTFRETDSKDFDVTIFDYDGDGFESPRVRISRDFSRPVVTVGVTGAFICDNLSLKTGYL
jgi:hypothetical protein